MALRLRTVEMDRLVDELVGARLRDGPDDVRDAILNHLLELAHRRQMSATLERVSRMLGEVRPADPLSRV